MQLVQSAFDRLRERINVNASGCWIWQGSTTKGGYGQIKVGKTVRSTHRLAYEATKGAIPRGKVIRHTCDVASCCNPAHLIVGDHEDNTQDIVERSAQKRRRVLHADEIAKALEMRSHGATKREVAEALACNWYTVSRALDEASPVPPRVGRPKGSRNTVTRISEEAKQEIRKLYATGKYTQSALAAQFGCDQTYVSLICKK